MIDAGLQKWVSFRWSFPSWNLQSHQEGRPVRNNCSTVWQMLPSVQTLKAMLKVVRCGAEQRRQATSTFKKDTDGR